MGFAVRFFETKCLFFPPFVMPLSSDKMTSFSQLFLTFYTKCKFDFTVEEAIIWSRKFSWRLIVITLPLFVGHKIMMLAFFLHTKVDL